MRSAIVSQTAFVQGLLSGLAFATVAVLGFAAVRRFTAGRADAMRLDGRPRIDGARPLNPIDRDLLATPESRATTRRLESEGPDPAIVTQRW